jgi:hypothetical protein
MDLIDKDTWNDLIVTTAIILAIILVVSFVLMIGLSPILF